MYTFIVLVALALSLSVLLQVLGELIPFQAPAVLRRTITVAIGAGLSWMLGYSVFEAFGQALHAEWMHPVMTGFALVAVGELVRSVVSAVAHRSGEQVDAAPAATTAHAA